jgi:hypothetical protein
MTKPKTHFEQVPLKIVKKIATSDPVEDAGSDRGGNKKPSIKLTSPVDSEE